MDEGLRVFRHVKLIKLTTLCQNDNMLHRAFLSSTFLLLVNLLIGQVVWTEPAFPTQFDDVTVYFDASRGNGGLEGFEGNVYAHTGVITTESNAPNDWKYVVGNWGTEDPQTLMTREDENLYSISYKIDEFYGVPEGELVEQLAFVFRNGDGSISGREEDGSDIFTDVFPPEDGLFVTLNAPSSTTNILFEGEELRIALDVNQTAQITIYDNEIEVFAEENSNIDVMYAPVGVGQHAFRIQIDNGEEVRELQFDALVLSESPEFGTPPAGIKNGLNYYNADSLCFQLYAPGKDYVFFLTSVNEFKPNPEYLMTQTLDGSTHWIILPKTLFEDGKASYQYLMNDDVIVADPYSTVVLDKWNDDEVNEAVLSELAPYPVDMADGIVTAFDLDYQQYNWTITDFQKPDKEQLIVYELLMRDFLEDKSYTSFLDTLDYLAELGVNAIELMPVNEFENNDSWGYNPSFHMAIDKYYGSRTQLKDVIDKAHSLGIAVILDVVYNHAFSQSPLCRMYWDDSAFRPTPDNPWLNVEATHPFNVGYDFNHQSPATKAWVKQVLEYMIEEYKFDGFRFDLSKGFTQKNSIGNIALMSQYDGSRIAILKEYANHIWDLDPNSYVILEHFADNNEEKELADYGMLLWGNIQHESAEAAMGYSSSFDWMDYKRRGWNDPHVITYMESHDEERMLYKVNTWGNSEGPYSTKSYPTNFKRAAAAAAIFYSVPGPKMLWQFQELGYDYSINYCPDGSIDEGCRLAPKPIRWDYLEDQNREVLWTRISELFHLRNTYPVFSTDNYELMDDDSYVKQVILNDPEIDVVTVANFNVTAESVQVAFPYTGIWFDFFNGIELNITDVNQTYTFEPGEYHIYTSEYLAPKYGVVSSTAELADIEEIAIFPNVIQSGVDTKVHLETNISLEQYQILNQEGRLILHERISENSSGALYLPATLTSGLHFIRMFDKHGRAFLSRLLVH